MSVSGFFGRVFNRPRRNSTKSRNKRSSVDGGGSSRDGMNAQLTFKQFQQVHTEPVTCSAAVSNGVCLSGGKDELVSLFDFNTGTSVQRWDVHNKEVTKVVYGAKISAFFSASRDKNVCMLKSGSPNVEQAYIGHDMVVTGLALNRENTQLCTGSRDNSLRLWDVNTGHCTLKNNISRNLISHVHWAENSDLIAQSGEDKEVRIFDSNNLEVVQTFPKKQYIQTWCEISEDGNYCVTCSNGFGGSGCEATLWDLRTTSIVHEFKGHYETCNCVRFVPPSLSHGHRLIVTASNDCSIRVWDRDSQECLNCTDISGAGPLSSISIFNDSRLCVSSFAVGVQVLQLHSKPGFVSLIRTAAF